MSGRSSSRWVAYCGVFGAKSRDDRGMLGGRGDGLEYRGTPFGAQPGESRPVLVPVIDEDRDPRVGGDVADSGERQGVVVPFRLVVDRRVEDRRLAGDDETDRHQPRLAVGRDRGQDGSSGGLEERALSG